MDSRTTYTKIFKILFFIGLGFALIPFISSLSTNPQTENTLWSSYYVGDMQAGELRKFPTAWIYKRTQKDKNYINRFAHLLVDPFSKTARQPEAARNVWRSTREDYFIFQPWSTRTRVSVKFSREQKLPTAAEVPEKSALLTNAYLWSPSNHYVWDMSGRLYQREDKPDEKNLYVPEVKWQSKDKVLVYNRSN